MRLRNPRWRMSLVRRLRQRQPCSQVCEVCFDPEKSVATDAALRDMVVPLSTLGSSVTISKDVKISQGGAHGVHVVFSYVPASGGAEETIDQTALFSGGKNAVYLLLVRCSSTCFEQNRDAIDSVTASYTIQEDQNG